MDITQFEGIIFDIRESGHQFRSNEMSTNSYAYHYYLTNKFHGSVWLLVACRIFNLGFWINKIYYIFLAIYKHDGKGRNISAKFTYNSFITYKIYYIYRPRNEFIPEGCFRSFLYEYVGRENLLFLLNNTKFCLQFLIK